MDKLAWDMVTSKTIVNCFKHCGVMELTEVGGDPFADLEGGGGDPSTDNDLKNALKY